MPYILNNGRTAVPENLSIYQVFIRNFTAEGTFDAAVSRLAGIREMGFDWVYVTPVHPVGKACRKGSLGSPYAIRDYREVEPSIGGLDGFRRFIAAAHKEGLQVMMDVVFNHTSPDSSLFRDHPEWFMRDPSGTPAGKCADWSDVIDFDYSNTELWMELISILQQWKNEGIDGFRCDVASLVPADFWVAARESVDPEFAMVWLAESVHAHFLADVRRRGFGAWCEAELHRAFDLTYDYDGWERLADAWSGTRSIRDYLDYLFVQESEYPQYARKIRCLENHDQLRAAWRFHEGGRLESWTLFYQMLPGCTFAYMGQEGAIAALPSLFEKEPVDWAKRSGSFEVFFRRAFSLTQAVKKRRTLFSWAMPAEGVVLLTRTGEGKSVTAVLNLDGRTGSVPLAAPLRGTDLLTGKPFSAEGTLVLGAMPLLVEY